MTSVNATVFEDDVSSDIVEFDIWSESLNVGRWRLLLKNIANKWGEDFNPNDLTDLKVDTISLMKGYVDDVLLPLDKRGVYTNMLELVGRDYGRNLARLFHTDDYGDVKADVILENILTNAQAGIPAEYKISYSAPEPAVGPIVNIRRVRTFLLDWLHEIAGRIDWGAYVDINRAFQFFNIANAPASGVTLKSVANAEDNNILDLLKGEAIGFSIANYIELSAGKLRGHWTNENAADWTPGTGCEQPTDDERADYKYSGMASIYLQRITNGIHSMSLDFPRYSHTSLDLSKPADMIFVVRHLPKVPPYPTVMPFRPRLEDSSGNVIEFRRSRKQGIGGVGHTDLQVHNRWHKLRIPLGEEQVIATGSQNLGEWYFIAPATTFDWADIVKIEFTSAIAIDSCDIWVDFLCISTIEVISRVESAASQTAYIKSMWPDDRPDIKSQVELDVMAPRELDKRKGPLKKIRVTAKGQTDTKYAGQTVLVLAPGHGIADATEYRIIKLHHKVRKESIQKGFNFTTEYDLVKHEVTPTVQGVDPLRFDLADDPRGTLINILNLSRRREREAAAAEMKALGDTHPMSTVFDELGIGPPGLPIYDPTGIHDYRNEAGEDAWSEVMTFKLPAYEKSQYLLNKIAVEAYRTTSASKGVLKIKVEYSVNSGGSWDLFGTIIEVEDATWTEYTRTDVAVADFNEPLWVKFSRRIYQEGTGETDGHLHDCELRERYHKTRWEAIE